MNVRIRLTSFLWLRRPLYCGPKSVKLTESGKKRRSASMTRFCFFLFYPFPSFLFPLIPFSFASIPCPRAPPRNNKSEGALWTSLAGLGMPVCQTVSGAFCIENIAIDSAWVIMLIGKMTISAQFQYSLLLLLTSDTAYKAQVCFVVSST